MGDYTIPGARSNVHIGLDIETADLEDRRHCVLSTATPLLMSSVNDLQKCQPDQPAHSGGT